MLKNQRPYQLVFSKTGSDFLSAAVAVCAKVAGICLASAISLFGREYADFKDINKVRTDLEKLCPKPVCDKATVPLLPCGEVDLSIIVPAYNAEKYIETCMESLLGQKTSKRVEIIVVNDNSTDKTLELLEKYRAKSNVKIIDFKNGGSAAKARNEGLLHAVGKYVMFVDSDDALEKEAAELLIDTAVDEGADIVQGGWRYIDQNGTRGNIQQYARAVYTGKHKLERFDLPGMPWAKIYKRELFEKIRFPSGYTAFEDAIVHFLVFRTAKKPVSVKQNVYLWRKNSEGITATSQNSPKAVQSYWIVEELLKKDSELIAKRDEMFEICLVGQLTNFCCVNVAKADKDLQKKLFFLCCDLYGKNAAQISGKRLPFVTKMGQKALKKKRFDLWLKQAKLYSIVK